RLLAREASSALLKIQQGRRRVVDYALEFRTLAADSGWNETSIIGAFMDGLAEEVKDFLAPSDIPRDFESLVEIASRIDNHLRERERETSAGSQVFGVFRVPGGAAPHSFRADCIPSPVLREEAMEEYITASLGSGIIRPSSSAAGAGFFFVVSFLGYVITANHISMDPAKVDAVTNWPPLTSKKKWNDKAEEAFNKLKQKFTTAPILTVPDPALQFVVEVDASNEGIGAVLSHRLPADNRIHPCAFLSRKLSAAERNYDVGNKELLLAVKVALEE
ncbi:hypothetical protein L3Q82_018363, partial [Scortum barcoo]